MSVLETITLETTKNCPSNNFANETQGIWNLCQHVALLLNHRSTMKNTVHVLTLALVLLLGERALAWNRSPLALSHGFVRHHPKQAGANSNSSVSVNATTAVSGDAILVKFADALRKARPDLVSLDDVQPMRTEWFVCSLV